MARTAHTNTKNELFWDGFQWVAKTSKLTPTLACGTTTQQQLHSTRKGRRLYIGNLPLHLGLTEAAFQVAFVEEMKRRQLMGQNDDNPVLCVWFAREKGNNYGFIEFASVEDADKSMALDGFLCMGTPIRISRPNDYTQTQQPSEAASNALGVLAQLSAQQLQQRGGVAASGTDLQGLAAAIPAAGGGVAAAVLGAGPLAGTTPYIKINRVVNEEEIEDPDEYDDILSDMKDGCGTHGSVQNAIIITPQLKQRVGALAAPFSAGDVLLQMSSPEEALNTLAKMSGRKYDNRAIAMMLFDPTDWAMHVEPMIAAAKATAAASTNGASPSNNGVPPPPPIAA
mmetsp:Transcript_30853/g.89743  ORF Transcript_30853/g.89743 Transcript_30853/m.89743 type:complete len:340 (+) Transcript_30853:159-1178(+)